VTPTTRALAARLCEAVRAATVRADQTIAADDLSLYLAQDALRAALAAEPRCTCAASRCLHEKGCPALAAEPETFLPLRDKPTATGSSDHPCALQDAEPTSGSGPRPNTGTYFEVAPSVPTERERLAATVDAAADAAQEQLAGLVCEERHTLTMLVSDLRAAARLLRAPVDREALARALSAHIIYHPAGPLCFCGWKPAPWPATKRGEEDTHRAHVADAILAAMGVEPHPALTCGVCGAQMMHVCLDCHNLAVAQPSDEEVARELMKMAKDDESIHAMLNALFSITAIVRAVNAARERARKGEG
jgi:hypothetical protein